MNIGYNAINNICFSFKESGNYYQTKNLQEGCQINDNDTFSTNSFKTISTKSYIKIAGCLLEHIICSTDLSSLEKLFYLHAYALSLINFNKGKQRAIALASNRWAKKLNCSKSTVFALQESLVKKGYFNILRKKNKHGQNDSNIIIPTIPDSIFEILKLSGNKTKELITEYNPETESKLGFLDRNKLFVKLNYYLLKTITSNIDLNHLQKIIYLDFYFKCYKYYLNTKGQGDCFFTASYQELLTIYSCNKSTLSKSINALEKAGFIKREHFFIKHEKYINARQDYSLWKFTISLPKILNPQEINIQDFFNISFIDPDNAKSGVHLKKNLLSVKDIDNIDINCQNLSKKSKNLSKFNNNSKKKNQLQPTAISCEREDINVTFEITNEKKKTLSVKTFKDFYPLSNKVVSSLNWQANREFNTNFTNQLLLKLFDKYPDKAFPNYYSFYAYMIKALRHEKHQAPKVNFETFRFVNGNEEARKEAEKERKIDKYLADVEYNNSIDNLSQLRRKVAVTFERGLAYELLNNSKFTFVEQLEEFNEEGVRINSNLFKIRLPNNIILTERQQQTLHELIVWVYGAVAIKYEKIEDRVGQYTISEKEEEINLEAVNSNSAWYKIRKGFINSYGIAMDKCWFSKLEVEENIVTNILTLKAPTNFIRDYISNNYGGIIQEYSKSLGLDVQFL